MDWKSQIESIRNLEKGWAPDIPEDSSVTEKHYSKEFCDRLEALMNLIVETTPIVVPLVSDEQDAEIQWDDGQLYLSISVSNNRMGVTCINRADGETYELWG